MCDISLIIEFWPSILNTSVIRVILQEKVGIAVIQWMTLTQLFSKRKQFRKEGHALNRQHLDLIGKTKDRSMHSKFMPKNRHDTLFKMRTFRMNSDEFLIAFIICVIRGGV